jgi:hypothetical protein
MPTATAVAPKETMKTMKFMAAKENPNVRVF